MHRTMLKSKIHRATEWREFPDRELVRGDVQRGADTPR